MDEPANAPKTETALTTVRSLPLRTLGGEQRRGVEVEPDPMDAPGRAGHGPGRSLVVAALVLCVMGAVAAIYRGPSGADAALPLPVPAPAKAAALDELTLPEVTPVAYQDLSPVAAEAWNAAFPIDTAPRDVMPAFRIPAEATADYARAVDCLTAAVHYEAATETVDGMRAVAQVVLNRVRHPAFPHTVCEVVFQGANLATGCQFTFTCDGALQRAPAPAAWARARQVAISALAGYVHGPVATATHYHTRWVVPTWAPKLSKIGDVGAHVFYAWRGGWGRARAFRSAYAQVETDVATVYGIGKAPFQAEPVQAQAQAQAPEIFLLPAPRSEQVPLPAAAPAPEREPPLVLAAAEPVTALESPAPPPVQARPEPAPQPTSNPLAARPARAARLPMANGF